MSTATTNRGYLKAVGSDNWRTYLKTSLATTLDAADTDMATALNPQALGGSVDVNRRLYLSGTYTGAVGANGLGVGYTLTIPSGGDGAMVLIDGVVKSAASGTNGHVCSLMVQPNPIAQGATVTNYSAAFFRQYDVTGYGAAHAYGIMVDSPIGATQNYSIQNSGRVQLRGASTLEFQQAADVTDALVGGATGNNVYIPGSQAGDLCVRLASSQKILVSVDGGVTAHAVLASTGLTLKVAELAFGVATVSIASSTVSDLTIGSSGCTTTIPGALRLSASAFVGSSTSNAKATGPALTINQGGSDDEILSMKSTDVAHGMTTQTETATFGEFNKVSAANGGVALRGFSAGTIGALVVGAHTTGNTTKTTSGTAAVYLQGSLKTGTTFGANGSTDNVAVIADHGSARFIFQADGSPYCDVGTAFTNFDDHDDVALLTDLSLAVSRPDDPIHAAFEDWTSTYDRERIQALDLVHFNEDGHHFMNLSKMLMLHTGAVRQLGDRLSAQAAEIAELRTRLALREAP